MIIGGLRLRYDRTQDNDAQIQQSALELQARHPARLAAGAEAQAGDHAGEAAALVAEDGVGRGVGDGVGGGRVQGGGPVRVFLRTIINIRTRGR